MERRDPIDRVVDFAFGVPIASVAMGRELTKIAAHGVIRTVQRAGADLAVRFVDERAAGSIVGESGAVNVAAGSPDGADVIVVSVVDTVEPAGRREVVELAIEGYDHLSARQIVGLLADLTDDELGGVEIYERSSRARRTVLGKIEQLRLDRATT